MNKLLDCISIHVLQDDTILLRHLSGYSSLLQWTCNSFIHLDTNSLQATSFKLHDCTLSELWSPDQNSDLDTDLANPGLSHGRFLCRFGLIYINLHYTSLVVRIHQDFSVCSCISSTFYRHKPSRACRREASAQHDAAATTRFHDGDGAFSVLCSVRLILKHRI